MLEKLNSIDWGQLKHAYGSAIDTPKYLKMLAQDDPKKQEEALDHLYSTINHQGSIYTASVASVPFLIEIIASTDIHLKHNSIELLWSLLSGTGYYDTHQDSTFYNEKRETPEFQAQIQEERSWVNKIRKQAEEGLSIYLSTLNDPNPKNRSYTILLLSRFTKFKQDITPGLISLIEREEDESVRANGIWLLACFEEVNSLDIFKKIIDNDSSELCRLIALTAYELSNDDKKPSDKYEEIKEMIINIDCEMIKQYNSLVIVNDYLCDIIAPLSRRYSAFSEAILPRIVSDMETGEYQGISTNYGLLQIALLPGDEKASFENLNEYQKKAVRLVALKTWSKPDSIFLNNLKVLQAFGLPDKYEAMEEFLGEPLHKPKKWWKFW